MVLSFYDHERQRYADAIKLPHAEFMIGEYATDGGSGGEFKIVLHDFSAVSSSDRGKLHPQVCVFGDGFEQFMVALARGLGSLFRDEIRSRDEFSLALIRLGFRDSSDHPLTVGA